MVRCFIAVKFGEDIESRLTELQDKAKKLGLDATFPQDFHCTLAFLGELYEDQVEKTKEKLEKLKIGPPQVTVKGASFFPNPNFIRVFWVGVEGLDEMQGKIANALGYKEKFSGHITLARIKAPKNREALKELAKDFENREFGKATVKEVTLYKSTLSAQGPKYEELYVKKLG